MAESRDFVVLLVTEAAVVHVVQLNRTIAAHDADGELVGAEPVFAEPAAFRATQAGLFM